MTTTKILAANVTSSRITVDIAAKTFGANDGTVGAPGVYFDAAATSGVYHLGSASLGISSSGTQHVGIGAGVVSMKVPVRPDVSATHNLGSATLRWDTVYGVTSDFSSDERLKQDIADSPLGLTFIRSLRPRVYRWRDTADTQAREGAVLDEAALARECEPHERRIKSIRQAQLAGKLSDADGDDQVAVARAELSEIQERHTRPLLEAQGKRRPGRRLHYGLIAQEVKEALDAAGVDAGFWHEDASGEQSLAYVELLAPAIRAIQEQDGTIQTQAVTIENLMARVAALEGDRNG